MSSTTKEHPVAPLLHPSSGRLDGAAEMKVKIEPGSAVSTVRYRENPEGGYSVLYEGGDGVHYFPTRAANWFDRLCEILRLSLYGGYRPRHHLTRRR